VGRVSMAGSVVKSAQSISIICSHTFAGRLRVVSAMTPGSNPSGYVVETLHAAFQAFFGTTRFEECLIGVVNRNGDAGITGAIAGMPAGALYGQEALPKPWLGARDPPIRRSCEAPARMLVERALEQGRLRV
jgi:ADP-ribosylglycohydrolase